MVRVGGGWDTLEHYLDKHDPCRCSSSGQCPWWGCGWMAEGQSAPVCGTTLHLPPALSPRSPPPAPAQGSRLLPTEGVAHPQPPRRQPSPWG